MVLIHAETAELAASRGKNADRDRQTAFQLYIVDENIIWIGNNYINYKLQNSTMQKQQLTGNKINFFWEKLLVTQSKKPIAS